MAWRDAADILVKVRREKGAQAHDLMRAGARSCNAALLLFGVVLGMRAPTKRLSDVLRFWDRCENAAGSPRSDWLTAWPSSCKAVGIVWAVTAAKGQEDVNEAQ